jgi:hypothetical protein
MQVRPRLPATPPSTEPTALHTRAMEDLQFIRQTMAGTAAYTAFSGRAILACGLGAVVTGFVAAHAPDLTSRLSIWLVDAALSVAIGALSSVLKARAAGQPVFAGPVRKFSLAFAPAVLAGAVLTAALLGGTLQQLLPGLWLLLYGVGLTSAGPHSVRIVPVVGALFFLLGTLALTVLAPFSDQLLWWGFAGLHVVMGWVIWRRHGG